MLNSIGKEDLFNALVHHSPSPAWISEGRRILFINHAGMKLLGGVSPSQFENHDLYEFVAPGCHRSVEERLSEMDAAPPVKQEFVRLDGSAVSVLFSSMRFPLEGRTAAQVHFPDLTAVELAGQAASQSSAEMDLISDKLPALISYLDPQGRFVKANATYAKWIGVAPADLLGRKAQDVLKEHIGPGYWEHIELAFEQALLGEASSTRATGEYPGGMREVEVHYSPDRDPSGHVRGVAVLAVDVTERLRIESEMELRATLLEEAMEPIFAWRLPGPITYWNRAAEETYGYSRAEAIGSISHLLLRTQASVPISQMESYLGKHGSWEGELIHTTKSGSVIVAEGRLRRIELAGQAFVVECTRDVTQRKRAERQLRELTSTLEGRVAQRTEELSQANEELEAYAYSISHDLRAPLRAMQGFSDALLEDYGDLLDEMGKTYARRIRAAAQRMDELIKDLLEYSRLGRSNFSIGKVEIRSVVADVLQLQQASIQEKKAVVDVSPDLPAVRGHYGTLVQIVGNLVSNALKFNGTEQTPEVEIAAGRLGTRVRVEIRDRGIGIAPQHRERVFKVFERLHGNETYPGTGIGLAIVKKGVERLGGTLGLSSEPGKGSCFWFELNAG